jgi:hypothetical protein
MSSFARPLQNEGHAPRDLWGFAGRATNPHEVVDVTLTSQEAVENLAPIHSDRTVMALGSLFQAEWPVGIQGVTTLPGNHWSLTLGREVAGRYPEITIEGYMEQQKRDARPTVDFSLPERWMLNDPRYADVVVAEADREPTEIFIVHGHDSAAEFEVARYVDQLTGRRSIILDEQSSRGQTVIEKFETCGDTAGFAIVLLTPDDEGGPVGAEKQLRARQNVIFELGYFVARVGRKRVVALTKGDIEIPSDLAGVVYISLDGDWRHRLGTELKEIESPGVDLNNA